MRTIDEVTVEQKKEKAEKVRGIVLRMRDQTIEQVTQDNCKNGNMTTLRKYVITRQITYTICSKLDYGTVEALGQMFKGQDHSTVSSAIKKTKELMFSSREYREEFERVFKRVEIEMKEVLFDWVDASGVGASWIECKYKNESVGSVSFIFQLDGNIVRINSYDLRWNSNPKHETYNEAKQWVESQFLEFLDSVR
jgi:hypothetical protein